MNKVYKVTKLYITDTEDNFDKGELPDTSNYFSVDVDIQCASVPECIKSVITNWLSNTFIDWETLSNNFEIDNGMITVYGYDNSAPITDSDIDGWMKHEFNLVSRQIAFEILSPLTSDELCASF